MSVVSATSEEHVFLCLCSAPQWCVHSRCHCAIRNETPTHPLRRMMSGKTSYLTMMKGEGRPTPQPLTLQPCKACTGCSTRTTAATCELSQRWQSGCGRVRVSLMFISLSQMVYSTKCAQSQEVQLEPSPPLRPGPSAAARLRSPVRTPLLRHAHAACSPRLSSWAAGGGLPVEPTDSRGCRRPFRQFPFHPQPEHL